MEHSIKEIIELSMPYLGYSLYVFTAFLLASAQFLRFRYDSLKANVQITIILAWLFQAVALIVSFLKPEAFDSSISYLFVGLSLANTNIIGEIHYEIKSAFTGMKYMFTSSYKSFIKSLHTNEV